MKNILSPETVAAIADVVTTALRTSRVSVIQPRRMTEHDAATYLGRSFYWLRNMRRADDERVANGGLRKGPLYAREGRTPFYYREDCDAWASLQKEAVDD